MMRLPWRRGGEKANLFNAERRLETAKVRACERLDESEELLERFVRLAEEEVRQHG